jgi:hypothetical protein
VNRPFASAKRRGCDPPAVIAKFECALSDLRMGQGIPVEIDRVPAEMNEGPHAPPSLDPYIIQPRHFMPHLSWCTSSPFSPLLHAGCGIRVNSMSQGLHCI